MANSHGAVLEQPCTHGNTLSDCTAPAPPTTVSDDDEVDFGYWEKATLPPSSDPLLHLPALPKTTREGDLDLL